MRNDKGKPTNSEFIAIIADLFHRMKYMERRGSGLKKIVAETEKLPGYDERYKPEFYSNHASFFVTLRNVNYVDLIAVRDTPQDKILQFCIYPRSKREIADHCGYSDLKHFTGHYLKPLLASGRLEMTLPDKPNSKLQKYVAVQAEKDDSGC